MGLFKRKPKLQLIPSPPQSVPNALDLVREQINRSVTDANERVDRMLERLRSMDPKPEGDK